MNFQKSFEKFNDILEDIASDPAGGQALVVLTQHMPAGEKRLAEWECLHTSMSMQELGRLLVYAAGSAMQAENEQTQKWDETAVRDFFDKVAAQTVAFLSEDDGPRPLLS